VAAKSRPKSTKKPAKKPASRRARTSPGPEVGTKAAKSNGFRVLFVDDDEGCRALVGDILGSHGFEVVSESTVDAGLQRAAHEEFDLVILDLMLPSGTGGEAAFKIRELDGDVPILALSGYLDRWDSDDLKALGFTNWMAKPFKTKALAKLAKELASK